MIQAAAQVSVIAPVKLADHDPAVGPGEQQDVVGHILQIGSSLPGIDALRNLVCPAPCRQLVDGTVSLPGFLRVPLVFRRPEAEVHRIKRVILPGDLTVKPMDELHSRENGSVLQKIIQRRLHHAEGLLRDRSVGRLFLAVGAERRLVKADQCVSARVASDDPQSLDGRGGHHGNRGLPRDQAERRRAFLPLGKPISIGLPPGTDPFGPRHRLPVDPEGNPVSRLDLRPVQLRPNGCGGLRGLQCVDADVQQRLGLRRVAERLQEECAFACRLLRDDHRAFFRKDIALILAVGQTADIRAGDRLVIAHVDTDMVIGFRKGDVRFDGFPHKTRKQRQLAARAVVIERLQHRPPPFRTSGLS